MNFSHEKEPGKNLTGIAIVIVVHIIVAWGIINGLGKRMITKMTEAVETKIVEDVKPPPPPETPPPPPPPEMQAPPPPFIPPVEVQVQQPPPPAPTITQTTSQRPATHEIIKGPPAPPTAAPVKAGPSHTSPVYDPNSCKPDYPSSAQRNEETGTTTVAFLISAEGHVMESKVEKSSGFRDLDKAALSAFGRCSYKPGTQEGKPVQSWVRIQYVWSLE
jgi:protein TonB